MTVVNSGSVLYNYVPHLVLNAQNEPGGVSLHYLPDEAQKFELGCFDSMRILDMNYPNVYQIYPDAVLLREASVTDTASHDGWNYSYYGNGWGGPSNLWSYVRIHTKLSNAEISGALEPNYPNHPDPKNPGEICTPEPWISACYGDVIYDGCIQWKETINEFSPGADDGSGGTWPDPKFEIVNHNGPFYACGECMCAAIELFDNDGYANPYPGQDTIYLDFVEQQTVITPSNTNSSFASDFYLWRQLSLSGWWEGKESWKPCSYNMEEGSRVRDYNNAYNWDDADVRFFFNANGYGLKEDLSNIEDLGEWVFSWGGMINHDYGDAIGQKTTYKHPSYSNIAGNSFGLTDGNQVDLEFGKGGNQYSINGAQWTINTAPADPPLEDDCYYLADQMPSTETYGLGYLDWSNYLSFTAKVSAQLDAKDLLNPGAWITADNASEFDGDGTDHASNLSSAFTDGGIKTSSLAWDEDFTNVNAGFYCDLGDDLQGSSLVWDPCNNNVLGKKWDWDLRVNGSSLEKPAVVEGGYPFSEDHFNVDWDNDPTAFMWDVIFLNQGSYETIRGKSNMYGTIEYQFLLQDIYLTVNKDSDYSGSYGYSITININESMGGDSVYENGMEITIDLEFAASTYRTDAILNLLIGAGLSNFFLAGGSSETIFDKDAQPIVFREGADLQYQATEANCSLVKEGSW